MSAYRSIIETLRNVAPRRLVAREIHAADGSHELGVVHLALHDMAQPDGPLERKKEGERPYDYQLRAGFNWEAWLDDKEGRMRGPREPDKQAGKQATPAVRVVHSVADRKDSATVKVEKPPGVNIDAVHSNVSATARPAANTAPASKPVGKDEVAPASTAVPRQLARENCLRLGREICRHLSARSNLDADPILRLLVEQHEFSNRMLEVLPT